VREERGYSRGEERKEWKGEYRGLLLRDGNGKERESKIRELRERGEEGETGEMEGGKKPALPIKSRSCAPF